MTRAAPAVPAPGAAAPAARTDWLAPFALTALAYALAGLLTLALAMPPSYASPLSPEAGIALASVLVYGWRMLGGVAIGALAVQLAIDAARGTGQPATLLVPLSMALGATLQAAVGAALVRRFVRWPLTLTAPRDVAAFLACCTASSVVDATIASAVLRSAAIVPPGQLAASWAAWWIGDLAGLLIATPVVLTLIGRPRAEWAPRRLSVGLTMTLVMLFLALGIAQATRWNEERVRAGFARDAASASLLLESQLEEPLHALEALRGVFNVGRHLGRAEMRSASERWLGRGSLRAMGWSERVRRDDIAAFEARARSEGSTGFRVVDGNDVPGSGDASAARTTRGEDVIAVRLVEPLQGNAASLGVNGLASATARTAILRAIDSGQPEATAGFRLAADDGGDAHTAIAVYQAIYDGDLGSVLDRRSSLRGLVFVVVDVDAQLAAVHGRLPPHVRLCVVDGDAAAGTLRLAGRTGCESATPGMASAHPVVFAGRQWDLRGSAEGDDDDAGGARRSAWIIAAAGLLTAAMLGASLLITTGRTRRIESAVRERTAALRSEVAERQLAEDALRASEQRFGNILDNVPIGVVYTDLAGRVIQANPRYCELTGYDEGELAKLDPAALTHPEDFANDQLLTAQLVGGEIPMYRRHKRCLNRAGEVVWVRSTVSLLRDAGNAPWRIVGVVEDITEHLRLEEAERAREAAELSNRAKSDFLSRMSHELRTPLNAMLGFAQLLEIDRRNPLTPGQRPWVSQIQQAGWHLLEMINDVLDLSRIDSGNLRLQTTTLELGELVDATIALVASDAAKRGIRISQQLAPEASAILGDATRVKQILTNLLSNAVKYNIEDGRVHVASRIAAPDVVEISVTDTGMGMTPEQMDELFRPFNRLGRERTTLQGTGIGLVISRRLAELMGGSIRVKSVPGEGSSFILKLPKAIDPDTVPSSLDDFAALPADYHRRIVLYVEDNETNIEVMRGILAQRAQVQMEVAVSGLSGLGSIRERMPHLILLDMHLPDMSGLDLLRHLKADPATSSIPVIVVSADATAQQVDAALDAGAVRYLTKPVGVNELLAAVDELLERMDTGFS